MFDRIFRLSGFFFNTMNRKQKIKELIRAYKYVQTYRKENKTLHLLHWLRKCEICLHQLQNNT